MHDQETHTQKAIRLLNRHLEELQLNIRTTNHTRPEFKAWHDTTAGMLERFLGSDSEHTTRFQRTRFSGSLRIRPFGSRPLPPDYVPNEDRAMFQRGCETAAATLKAAIQTIEDFGVHGPRVEHPHEAPAKKERQGSGGWVHQTFINARVNQAIATDNATQRVEHVGDKVGPSISEIGELLKQSDSITARQLSEALQGIEALIAETRKPEEKRDWKSILTYSQLVLGVVDKAADVGPKFAPYVTHIAALVEAAKHYL